MMPHGAGAFPRGERARSCGGPAPPMMPRRRPRGNPGGAGRGAGRRALPERPERGRGNVQGRRWLARRVFRAARATSSATAGRSPTGDVPGTGVALSTRKLERSFQVAAARRNTRVRKGSESFGRFPNLVAGATIGRSGNNTQHFPPPCSTRVPGRNFGRCTGNGGRDSTQPVRGAPGTGVPLSTGGLAMISSQDGRGGGPPRKGLSRPAFPRRPGPRSRRTFQPVRREGPLAVGVRPDTRRRTASPAVLSTGGPGSTSARGDRDGRRRPKGLSCLPVPGETGPPFPAHLPNPVRGRVRW